MIKEEFLSRSGLANHPRIYVHFCLLVQQIQQQDYAISISNFYDTANKTIELAAIYSDRLAMLERRHGCGNDAPCFARSQAFDKSGWQERQRVPVLNN